MQQTTYLQFAFFQGKVVKYEDAKIPISTNALQYGTGIFGGIRAYLSGDKKSLNVFRIDDHFKRFLNSTKILGITIKYSQEELKKIALDLLEKNKPTSDTYIRPFAYAGSTNLSPNLERDSEFDLAIYMLPLGEYLPVDKGLSVAVSSWRRVSDNAIPARGKFSGSYINSALARQEANKNGFDEAILLTEDGHVAEGSAENIFIVKNGTLITPPESDDVLEGIVRRTILQLTEDLNIPTQIRSIDRSELYAADEAFFSGTGVQVSWISKVDHRVLGDGKRGPITEKLQDTFFKIVRGEEPKYSNWLTKIDVG